MFKNIGQTIKIISKIIFIFFAGYSALLILICAWNFFVELYDFSTQLEQEMRFEWSEIANPLQLSARMLIFGITLSVSVYAFGEFMCYMKSISESLRDLSYNENQKDIDYEYEEDEIVKCPYCNSDMESDAFFCPSCHKKVVK